MLHTWHNPFEFEHGIYREVFDYSVLFFESVGVYQYYVNSILKNLDGTTVTFEEKNQNKKKSSQSVFWCNKFLVVFL
jgi:hypothetical protein